MNLEIKQQQSRTQFTLRTDKMIQQSGFGIFARSVRSTAIHGRSAADLSPAYTAATLPRPVYESSFWTPKEVYEKSHSR